MPQTGRQLDDRLARIASHLAHWGDVSVRDLGQSRERRLLEFLLIAPGHALEPEAKALFREYYRRHGADWNVAKYTYEYLDLNRSWRLAYHLHEVAGGSTVAHAHCEPATEFASAEGSNHLRAVEYDLREANAEFMRLYASDRAPDCASFLPLQLDRR